MLEYLRIFFPVLIDMNKQKKCEKLKALTTGRKVLNLPFNVLMIAINKIGTV